ncbi:MAG: hypothetical protein Q9M27_06390 [Mariprofundaceae bacterium]|nr:hypothetical protein [Mariprofundaceae bacterium]
MTNLAVNHILDRWAHVEINDFDAIDQIAALGVGWAIRAKQERDEINCDCNCGAGHKCGPTGYCGY